MFEAMGVEELAGRCIHKLVTLVTLIKKFWTKKYSNTVEVNLVILTCVSTWQVSTGQPLNKPQFATHKVNKSLLSTEASLNQSISTVQFTWIELDRLR